MNLPHPRPEEILAVAKEAEPEAHRVKVGVTFMPEVH